LPHIASLRNLSLAHNACITENQLILYAQHFTALRHLDLIGTTVTTPVSENLQKHFFGA
jgi:hypothetical protein